MSAELSPGIGIYDLDGAGMLGQEVRDRVGRTRQSPDREVWDRSIPTGSASALHITPYQGAVKQGASPSAADQFGQETSVQFSSVAWKFIRACCAAVADPVKGTLPVSNSSISICIASFSLVCKHEQGPMPCGLGWIVAMPDGVVTA